MKIVDRKEFLSFSAGTLFIEFESSSLPAGSAFMIKGNTLTPMDENSLGDFYEMSLSDWQNSNSDELYDNFLAMKDEGKSFPIDFAWGRNALYERNALYLIYEKEDVMHLRDLLDRCFTGNIDG